MPFRLKTGDGKLPNSALSVETSNGQIAYEGTPAEPLIKFEDCLAKTKRKRQTMRLWTINLLEAEIAGFKDKSRPKGPWSPMQDTLP